MVSHEGEDRNARVWVGRIDDNANKEDVRKALSEFGEVVDVKFFRKSRNDSFAFVQFRKVYSADRAMKDGDGLKIQGRAVKIGHANPSSQDEGSRTPPRSSFYSNEEKGGGASRRRQSRSRSREDRKEPTGGFRVRIENLPLDMTWQELERLGSDYGKSVDYVRTYKEKTMVVGLIEFTDKRDAQKLVSGLDGKKMEGSELRLRAKHEDPEVDGERRRRDRA
jgi:RNA recognition motif-containing protein